MEQRVNEGEMMSTQGLAIFPRLERIDRLVHLVEEKHGHECWCKCKRRLLISGNNMDVIDNNVNKSLFSAMEEVQHKGTLMERLEILENRVLQYEGVSTSKCSDSAVHENESTTPGSKNAFSYNPKERLDKADSGNGRRKWFNFKFKFTRMGCDH